MSALQAKLSELEALFARALGLYGWEAMEPSAFFGIIAGVRNIASRAPAR